ncbi:MAG: transposase [Planctomycetota bacterium]|nr:transposase [Planctomycetota bacterium]
MLEPLDFMARLAARVPWSRAHLLTYHGVLATAGCGHRPKLSTAPAGLQRGPGT